MKLSVQSGAKIAAAVAALMLAGSVAAPSAANAGVCPITGHDANACKGKASCKGKGSCKGNESWLRKSGQCDKWNFCLTAGNMSPLNRRDHEQTSTAEPHIGLQG